MIRKSPYNRKPTNIPDLLIDDEDRHLIEGSCYRVNHKGYVVTMRFKGYGKPTFFQLHREVMQPPPGAIVDHINGNKLDNRKCNLRIVSQSHNMQNLRKKKLGKSGYRNVALVHGRWVVRIRLNGKVVQKHGFKTAEEAAACAEEMRRQFMPGYSLENREYGT